MRVLSIVLVLLTLATACGSAAAVSAPSTATQAAVPPTTAAVAPCTQRSTVKPTLSPARGSAGTRVVITGILPRGGSSHATTKLEAFWNLDFTRWFTALTAHPTAAHNGPVLKVARVVVPRPNPCSFRLVFRVPRVEAGAYPVVVSYFTAPLTASSFAPAPFTVTP